MQKLVDVTFLICDINLKPKLVAHSSALQVHTIINNTLSII